MEWIWVQSISTVWRLTGADVGAQLFQNLQTQRHIGDLGDIFNAADTVHHQRGGDDGDGGVFRAADLYFTKQGITALYYIFCQTRLPSLKTKLLSRRQRPVLYGQFARPMQAHHAAEQCSVDKKT